MTRSYRVDVVGLGGPRNRQGRSAGIALVLLAALVGGAVLSSRLFPVERETSAPTRAAEASAASGSSSAAPSASPAQAVVPVPSGPVTARITAHAVDVAALVAAIPRHGTGPLAFVAGRLRTTRRPCEPDAPLSACMTLRIDGLRGAKVVPDDTMAVWPGDPVLGETIVLLPRDGLLVFLGSLLVDPVGIPRIDTLTATMTAVPTGPSQLLPSLHEADGVLVGDAASCAADALGCARGTPTILAVLPSDDGVPDRTGAQAVRIVDGAFGIRPEARWTTGPFLLRLRTDAAPGVAWDVVAREDQGSILRVVIP